MIALEFTEWMDQMWLSDREAAKMLGVSVRKIHRFQANGAPLYIGLACSALTRKLPSWSRTIRS